MSEYIPFQNEKNKLHVERLTYKLHDEYLLFKKHNKNSVNSDEAFFEQVLLTMGTSDLAVGTVIEGVESRIKSINSIDLSEVNTMQKMIAQEANGSKVKLLTDFLSFLKSLNNEES